LFAFFFSGALVQDFLLAFFTLCATAPRLLRDIGHEAKEQRNEQTHAARGLSPLRRYDS
jgi:hypothetical protein